MPKNVHLYSQPADLQAVWMRFDQVLGQDEGIKFFLNEVLKTSVAFKDYSGTEDSASAKEGGLCHKRRPLPFQGDHAL